MIPIIDEFLIYLSQQGYSENTYKSHRLDLIKFEEWLLAQDKKALTQISTLKPEEVSKYFDILFTELKARTVARHISSLKKFFHYLETQGTLTNNPMGQISFPEIQYDAPQMLSPEEIIALLEAPVSTHYLGLRDRAMLELSYSSGLKVNELLQLNTEDLFLDLAFVKVHGKKQRMVPLTSKAIEVLKQYLESSRLQRLLNKEDQCLFPNRNGVRMTRIGFWFMIKKHAKRAGIESKINARILRHSFAMHLIQNGMDLSDIQNLFGYIDLDATQQYAHINPPQYEQTYRQYHPRGKVHSE